MAESGASEPVAEFFSEHRMKYGHLTILFLYGLLVFFLLGPFVALWLFPPTESVHLASIGPYYWQRLPSLAGTGVVINLLLALNAGLILYAFQVLTNKLYWKWIVKPIARHLFRLKSECADIDKHLIESARFPDKRVYAQFLFWVEQQEHKRRVRSWDWFIANAIRTLGFVAFLYVLSSAAAALTVVLFPLLSTVVAVSLKSWALTVVAAVITILLVPADVKHYLVHAAADSVLYDEFTNVSGIPRPGSSP
ncbi:MAG: hypothetical protein G01um1014106_97 [Parcubacteria group bacterium Gr01-1014_106]|nr:MAG: hypothetical protein G01um1014106_97 [Parcubacteria group bacterium Gr01-1014_106]